MIDFAAAALRKRQQREKTMKYLNSEGSFEAIVTEPSAGWIGEAGQNLSPFIRIPVQVIEDGPEKGAIGIWQGYLTDDAFEKTIKRLAEAIGFNGDLYSLTTGKQTLVGKPCNITTKLEEYNNKTRCKIAWLNAPGGGGAKPIEPRKLDSLLNKLNTRSMQIAKAATLTKAFVEGGGISVKEMEESDSVPF